MRALLARMIALSAAAVLLAGGAAAARADSGVMLQVGTVLATNTGEHFDVQLTRLRPRLQKMFDYSSYRLVMEESRGVAWDDRVEFSIPGGHRLRIRAREPRAEQVALNLSLHHGDRTLVDTDFTVGNDGTVFLGGPRHENGVLIIWVGARTNVPPLAPVARSE